MKQTYHANATTNVRLRSIINQSNLTNFELSRQYDLSENTISKWKNRDYFEDKSSRPKTLKMNTFFILTCKFIKTMYIRKVILIFNLF